VQRSSSGDRRSVARKPEAIRAGSASTPGRSRHRYCAHFDHGRVRGRLSPAVQRHAARAGCRQRCAGARRRAGWKSPGAVRVPATVASSAGVPERGKACDRRQDCGDARQHSGNVVQKVRNDPSVCLRDGRPRRVQASLQHLNQTPEETAAQPIERCRRCNPLSIAILAALVSRPPCYTLSFFAVLGRRRAAASFASASRSSARRRRGTAR